MISTIVLIVVVLALWAGAWQIESLRGRQLLLLLGSYVFYFWFGGTMLAMLVASSLVNFRLGRLVRTLRLEFLWLAVGLNIVLIAAFKYLPPILDAAGSPSQADLARRIVIPVGMSFWTFQALSYHIDTYLEDVGQPSLLEFCLYMAFWPTVISGPVCRLPEMLPQFRRTPQFSRQDLSDGVLQIIQGVCMKFYLAQLLASGWSRGAGVTAGFDATVGWGGLDVWLLAVGYGFQLFFDFAGYSLMVIGVARVFGIRLPQNFNRPYLSLTPAIFWTRWHMSLSFWIRDYVFRPLSAMRRDKWWLYVSLLIAMTLFGLWHGARWTFMLWGIYQGLLLVGHRMGQRAKKWASIQVPPALGACLAWATTFAFVSLGYVFFRASSLAQLGTMLEAALTPSSYRHVVLPQAYYQLTITVVAGYFLVAGGSALLRSWRARYRAADKSRVASTSLIPLTWADVPYTAGATVDFLATSLWWWLAPALVTLGGLAALATYIQSARIATTPFIYTLF